MFSCQDRDVGALPVLVPGWGGVCVCPSSVWYLGDIRRGSAVHTSFISIKYNIVSLSLFSHPPNYFFSFLLSFLLPASPIQPLPVREGSFHLLACRCRAPGRIASAGRHTGCGASAMLPLHLELTHPIGLKFSKLFQPRLSIFN